MTIITLSGHVFREKEDRLVKATLADLLDAIKEARESLETWSMCLEWDVREQNDIRECVEGIKYWSKEERRLLDMIDKGNYAEVNSYAVD